MAPLTPKEYILLILFVIFLGFVGLGLGWIVAKIILI